MCISFLEVLILLLVVGLPLALLAALIVIVVRNRDGAAAGVREKTRNSVERSEVLRRRRDTYHEERSRILEMVDNGRVSAEEADRLLEVLERETTTVACSFCGGEIRVEAIKCKHCRQYLAEELVRPGRLTKSRDRLLAGVCGGVAEYFGIDPSIVRILTALAIFFSGIVTGLIVYFIAAVILPGAD